MLEFPMIFLAFLALGVSGMPPSITFGDAGELTAASASLGVAHAPGYPLYCLLGKAFGAALPWGNWAYRTNLLSVVCGAAALSLLGDALRRSGFSRPARLAAVACLGLTPLWLYENSVTEVFAF